MPKITLSTTFLKTGLTCPPDKTRIEYCDTVIPGLYCEVRATSPGQGTFYLRYKDTAGKTKHLKLGRTDITLTQARKKARSEKAKVQLGADPAADAKALKEVLTFQAFATDHYLPYAKLRKRSYRNDEAMLRLRLLPEFGSLRLNRITKQQIQTFHTRLAAEDLSPAHCDHHLKLLRSMLNLAVDWGYITVNPATKVKLYNANNKKERLLSPEEQARLLTELQNHQQYGKTICLFLTFLLSTGARLNEALQADWADIDIQKKQWTIPIAHSKSKKARTVPLNATARATLQALPRVPSQVEVFRNTKTKRRYVNINKTWYQIRAAAGLPDVRLHDLRHQYASNLVNAGRSLYEVQQILGHSDPSVTQRYAHLSTTALQEAANAGDLGVVPEQQKTGTD